MGTGRGTLVHVGRAEGPHRFLPREVEAEDGLGELVLLQHALQHGGQPSHRQRGVGHSQDPIKLGVVERLGRLVLAQPEILVSDRDALDLEGKGVPGQPACSGKPRQPSDGMTDALKAQQAHRKVKTSPGSLEN